MNALKIGSAAALAALALAGCGDNDHDSDVAQLPQLAPAVGASWAHAPSWPAASATRKPS